MTGDFPTIKRGSTGKAVVLFQCLLYDLGYNIGNAGIVGIYGGDTLSACRSFQKMNNLIVDGICGNQTWTQLIKMWWEMSY